MNVYQKLIQARKSFLDSGVKKSGKNIHLEFKYFELSDIVPIATNIFAEIGLIGITSFTDDEATLTIVNCDDPNEKIVFTSPMRDVPTITSRDGKSVTNPIQTLGSIETYQRRYLYLIALDIVEDDSIDNATGNDSQKTTTTVKKPSVAAPKKEELKTPATPEERKEIKKELTSQKDEKPSSEELKEFKSLLEELINTIPTERNFVVDILAKTDQLNKITKQQLTLVSEHVKAKLDSVKEKPVVDDKPVTVIEKAEFKDLLTKLVTVNPSEKPYVVDILTKTDKLANITREQLEKWRNEVNSKL